MKKNKNHLFRISFFISITIHVLAIACVNHIEIRSYFSCGNVSFSNKTDLPYKKKKPKEIMNLILKQKQKDLQALIENNPILALPEKEKNKNITNNFVYQNEQLEKKDFVFHLSTLITQNKLIEKEKEATELQIEPENSSLTSSQIKKYALNFKDSNSSFNLPLSEIKKDLPDIEIEKQNIPIPAFGMKNYDVISFHQSSDSSHLPKSEIEKIYSIDLTKEFYAKVEDLFKFQELINNEEILTNDLTKYKKKEIALFSQNFSLIDMPQLKDLTTLPYKDYFDIEVTLSPQINEKGYIFAITFVPKHSIKLNRLKQNIFFLVDRSNSIQKDRLTLTRHAITSSLPFLNEEDSFNILAFDTKLDVLSNINLKNDNISLSRARGFLRKQNIGSFFSSTNFSIPLYKILDKNVKDNEINVAILISNGDGLQKFKNNRVINDWTQLNGGNLSLYTLCLSDDKNLSILELFSSLNKGKLLSSQTTKGIKRKLQRLLKSISEPIAKNIIANAICLDDKANIKLYPQNHQSPHLYINEPYTILGTIEKLQDFTIFLQGKCKNNHFNLKKHISFDDVKQGGSDLQKELAMKQASICYEKYLADNNPKHLQEAKNHLKPFDIQPIFR